MVFGGRRIEWRCFWFYQIQDGGSAAARMIRYGNITFEFSMMFGSKVGFWGWWIERRYFQFDQIQ